MGEEKKNGAVVLMLWFFFGYLGLHRIYVGKKKSGFTMLGLLIIGWVMLLAGSTIGVALLVILGLWYVIDLFLFALRKIK